MTEKFYQPGNCPSKPEAIRRVARKIASAARNIREAEEWCRYYQFNPEADWLDVMQRHAASIATLLDTRADNARAPGSPKTRNP